MAEPSLPVAAVARRLGVAPATLRTWDRRYGLGPSEHVPGVHRRYTSQDLRRLEAMVGFIKQGVAPGDAAVAVLAPDARIGEGDASTPQFYADMPGADMPGAGALGAGPPGAGPPGAGPPGSGAPGAEVPGFVVPGAAGAPPGSMARVRADARGLARSAVALDSRAMTSRIEASLSHRGVIPTWDQLVAPALIGVGDRYASTGRGVEIEHALSEAALSALRPLPTQLGESLNARPVLLAAADEEQHTLPLYAAAAALAERRVHARVLGARVPSEALSAAITRMGPGAILVWSQIEETGDIAQLERIPSQRPSALVLVGGPGWPAELPVGVERPANLADAVALLTAAVTSH